jgi:hypothetical protein
LTDLAAAPFGFKPMFVNRSVRWVLIVFLSCQADLGFTFRLVEENAYGHFGWLCIDSVRREFAQTVFKHVCCGESVAIRYHVTSRYSCSTWAYWCVMRWRYTTIVGLLGGVSKS